MSKMHVNQFQFTYKSHALLFVRTKSLKQRKIIKNNNVTNLHVLLKYTFYNKLKWIFRILKYKYILFGFQKDLHMQNVLHDLLYNKKM